MDRAYSILTIKAVDEEKRIIEGLASTPEPDRMGDIVDPMGAEFKLPVPFLWQHDSYSPIGQVVEAKASKDGIMVKAQIAALGISEQIDEAWALIKAKLVRGLSIGFRSLDSEQIPNSWGMIFKRWELLEISAVTIPANADATIINIRSVDGPLLAASGQRRGDPGRKPPAVADKSGLASRVVDLKPKSKRSPAMDIATSIKTYQETRATKAARMAAILETAEKRGETLTAEEAAEYDEVAAEVKSIDAHIERYTALEKAQSTTAKPLGKVEKPDDGANVRDPQFHNTVKAAPKAEPGVRFARVAKCLALAQGNRREAALLAAERYKDDPGIAATLKSAVLAGTTDGATWAGPLVGEETTVFADFVEFLRPQTILGRFGAGGIPSLRRVPFRVALIGQTSGGAGYWVGEGKPKPLTSFAFGRNTLEPLKVANIAVVTEEVLRDSSPSADLIVRDSLAAALRERLDTDFIDPNKSPAASVSPGSILNGISPIPSTGATADDIRKDLKKLFAAFIAANNAPTNGVFIMAATTALGTSLLMNPLGQPEFPNLTMNGGNLSGLPVITSEYVKSDSSGSLVALVNASDIYLGDEGGIAIDLSREASLEMADDPTNDGSPPPKPQMVSLWQTNSVGFRAERTINWSRRRASAAAYLSAVNWGV